MNESYLIVVFFIIGVLTRMTLPWAVKVVNQLRDEENVEDIKWNWRYLTGQLLATIVVLSLTQLLVSDFEVAFETRRSAWMTGYVVAETGRMLDKLISK